MKGAFIYPLMLAFLCSVVMAQVGVAPTWAYDNNFRCGTANILTSARDTGFTFNITHNSAFTGSNPHVSLGINRLELDTASSTRIYFLINVGTQTLTNFVVQVGLVSGFKIKYIALSYFARASTLSYIFVDYQSVIPTNLTSGSGNRESQAIVKFSSNATIDLTHKYFVVPYLTGVDITKNSPNNGHIELLTQLFNSTHYSCRYKTSLATIVNSVTYYSITYDQTVVQQTQNQYIDNTFKTGSNNVENSFSLIASSAANFHSGLNTFNFTNANGLNFNFQSNYSLSTGTSYLYLNISSFNNRIRTCASPNIYYLEPQNLCYSTCPAGYFANTTFSFCQACHYSCSTCTGPNSTHCSGCSSANFRTLSSNNCSCNIGYYDGATATCVACNSTCKTCTSTSCLSCHSANAIVQGTGCVCFSGFYYDATTKNCLACPSNCSTCTSSTTCTGCSMSGLTLSSGSCVCSNTTYFLNASASACQPCIDYLQGCNKCQNSSVCEACIAGMTLASGSCSCAAGFYYNMTSKTCSACPSLCATCTSATTCTSCTNSTLTVSSGSCVCSNSTYFLNSTAGGCEPCINYLQGCNSCQNSTTCQACITGMTLSSGSCSCAAGFYYNTTSKTCSACPSLCATCTSATTCTSCTNSTLTVSSGSCVCSNSTYFLNSTAGGCEPCINYLQGCNSCQNSTTCQACITGMTLSSGSCSCSAGYYYNSASPSCVACHSTCAACNSTTCLTCISPGMTVNGSSCKCSSTSSYYDTTSSSCVACGSQCATCTSSTVCTSCFSQDYSVSGGTCVCSTGSCITCGTACATCTSTTSCTTCVSNTMTPTGGNCSCTNTNSYFDSSSNTCVDCPTGCSSCTNLSSCTACYDQPNMSSAATKCICNSGKYFEQSNRTCVSCMAQCLTCNASNTCASCNSSLHRTLNGAGRCQCSTGYTLNTTSGQCQAAVVGTCPTGYQNVTGTCTQICGDGKLYELACDDGNKINGDGCNQKCQIQTDFVCKDGSTTSPSICSYNKSLNLDLKLAYKNLFENSIEFTFKVSPVLDVINQFSVAYDVTTNLPYNHIDNYYSNGILYVMIFYTESIQNKNATVTLTPPSNVERAYAMKASSAQFVVRPTNNAPAIFYENTTYDNAKLFDTIIKYSVFVALGIAFLGTYFGRLVALEMMTAVQLVFFSLAMMDMLHPMLAPVAKYARISHGYNELFETVDGLYTFNHPEVPSTVWGIGYEAQFLYNFNYFLFVAVGIFIMVGLFALFGLTKSGHKTNCIEKFYGFLIRQMMLSWSLFCCCVISYATAIQVMYGRDDSNFIINIGVAAGSQIPTIFIIILYIFTNDKFKDPKDWLKKDKMSISHPIVLLVVRSLLGVAAATHNILSQSISFMVALEGIYMFYLILNRPYVKGYMTFRGIVNELLFCVGLFVPLYHAQLKDKFNLTSIEDKLPWFTVGSMLGMMFLAFLSLLVWWIQRLCSKPSKNSVYPVDSGSENRDLSSEDQEEQQNKQLQVEQVDMNESEINIQKKPQVIAMDKKTTGVKRYKRFRQEI